MPTLVRGKTNNSGILNRGGVELNSKCKHAISKGISGGPTYYMAYGQDLSTSKNQIMEKNILSSNKNFMLRIVLLTGRLHQINENTQEYIYA